MTDSRIYDAIEYISLDREVLKKRIKPDVDNYKFNAMKVPIAFKYVYDKHLPYFVSKLLVNQILDEFHLNGEEILILQETLVNSNPQILGYFYEN